MAEAGLKYSQMPSSKNEYKLIKYLNCYVTKRGMKTPRKEKAEYISKKS